MTNDIKNLLKDNYINSKPFIVRLYKLYLAYILI